jgi:hypothetical protein
LSSSDELSSLSSGCRVNLRGEGGGWCVVSVSVGVDGMGWCNEASLGAETTTAGCGRGVVWTCTLAVMTAAIAGLPSACNVASPSRLRASGAKGVIKKTPPAVRSCCNSRLSLVPAGLRSTRGRVSYRVSHRVPVPTPPSANVGLVGSRTNNTTALLFRHRLLVTVRLPLRLTGLFPSHALNFSSKSAAGLLHSSPRPRSR